ncbi:MAG: hypothetical protein JWM82_2184, partial [Myxococcales bacterium]|nr:hypothetical protein [Myxococcales bacterium]
EVDVRLYAPRQIRARVPPTPLRARVNEYRIAPTLAAQGGDPT